MALMPMPGQIQDQVGRHLSALDDILLELRELRAALGDRGVDTLAVADDIDAPSTTKDFPVAGQTRVIMGRTPDAPQNGGVAAAAPGGTLVFLSNINRIGGRVTNTGAVPVVLFLSDQARAGAGRVQLPAGAVWDFKLGDLLWCGNIFAQGVGGAGSIDGCEV